MQFDFFSHPPVNKTDSRILSIRLHDGAAITFSVRRNARATRIRLTINQSGLVVSASPRVPIAELEDAVRSKSDWILRHLKTVELAAAKPVSPALVHGTELSYLGGKLRLHVGAAPGARASAVLRPDGLHAFIPANRPELLRPVVEAWYREIAKSFITARVTALAAGRKVGRVTIKDQKTRWGSCSSAGNLNFNWRLVMTPPEVIDYLVIHELTHMDVLDHSERFWRKVAAACPDYKERRAWLKSHGRTLKI